MKTLAILQARISSTRLPGKVLLPILGKPMLLRQIERLKRGSGYDELIVATSDDPSDDGLATICENYGIECFRGSLNNLLDRIVRAARPYRPEAVVRLTGDCPLADHVLIDQVINYFYVGNYDYFSNCNPPTFPDGLDVEVIRFSCLEQAHRETRLPSNHERFPAWIYYHPAWIYYHPEKFRVGNFVNELDLSHLRWTVDEPEDLEFVRSVYEKLYPTKPNFTTADILDLVTKCPDLQAINSGFERNEGLKKSLEVEADCLNRVNDVNTL